MANSPQARKRARQADKRREQNAAQRSSMRTAIKRTVAAITAGDKTQAEDAYKAAVPAIDKLVNKGLVHKNQAARNKSRLNARIRAM
ncbi:MAG: 30S ribosomal protein S20 [Pseudomonadota bacterium]|nr:MAG: 30S ribosomal protein S20 [Pseudomonadota bacterium]